MLRTRRALLGALTALPAIYSRGWAENATSPATIFRKEPDPVTSADQVLNVMEFEQLAREALPPAHFGYIATGADDDLRSRAITMRSRTTRFACVASTTSVSSTRRPRCSEQNGRARCISLLFRRSAHFTLTAEVAVARAAKSRSIQMMLSSGTSAALEEVRDARGAPIWQQLYPTNDWKVATAIVRHAESAGCPAIVLTVDLPGPRNNETLTRAFRVDNRPCVSCHVDNSHDMWRRGPMFKGLDVSKVTGLAPAGITPKYLDQLRALVKGRLIIKGVMEGADAALAVEHGADAIVISNHGGRNEESLRAHRGLSTRSGSGSARPRADIHRRRHSARH